MIDPKFRKLCDDLAGTLVDRNMLVAVGFNESRKMVMHPEAPIGQIAEMQMAFYAGAQHVFFSVMGVLDDGEEITDKDMERMSRVADELERFAEQFKAADSNTMGRA